jgi:hypothetical protein
MSWKGLTKSVTRVRSLHMLLTTGKTANLDV